MSVKEMSRWLGQEVSFHSKDGFHLPMKVVDVREVYGNVHLRIQTALRVFGLS